MLNVFRQLVHDIEQRRPVAYCRLLETRGSTPQKAGAVMLVYADGSQCGTLGGGCVEAEVKRQAIGVLEQTVPQLCTFNLDSDYGWDDGLICGGRMKVMVEPCHSGNQGSQEYFSQLVALASGPGATEAIAFETAAARESGPTACLFDAQGRLVNARRAAAADLAAVAGQLRNLADRPRPYAVQGIAYLPLLPRCRLIIVGGGHIGQAVYELAVELDFDVWVVDDRADVCTTDRFPQAQRRIVGEIQEVLPELEVTGDSYCLIVTRGHNHDEKALYYLVNRGASYVGLIGSKRKIKMIFDDLLAEGISAEALRQVYAPVGIDIGSQTVPEIAVAIAAELVAHRNRGEIPGRPAAIPVQASP